MITKEFPSFVNINSPDNVTIKLIKTFAHASYDAPSEGRSNPVAIKLASAVRVIVGCCKWKSNTRRVCACVCTRITRDVDAPRIEYLRSAGLLARGRSTHPSERGSIESETSILQRSYDVPREAKIFEKSRNASSISRIFLREKTHFFFRVVFRTFFVLEKIWQLFGYKYFISNIYK